MSASSNQNDITKHHVRFTLFDILGRWLFTTNKELLLCIVLYCIVLYCIVLYCIVLYCIVLYCIGLDWIGLDWIILLLVTLHTKSKLANDSQSTIRKIKMKHTYQ